MQKTPETVVVAAVSPIWDAAKFIYAIRKSGWHIFLCLKKRKYYSFALRTVIVLKSARRLQKCWEEKI